MRRGAGAYAALLPFFTLELHGTARLRLLETTPRTSPLIPMRDLPDPPCTTRLIRLARPALSPMHVSLTILGPRYDDSVSTF